MLAVNTAEIYFDHSNLAGVFSYLFMTSMLIAALWRTNKTKMQSVSTW